jgi:hypothetical protein
MRGPRKMALITGGAEAIGDGVLAVAPSGGKGNVVLCQVVPWEFDYSKQYCSSAP